MSSEGSEVEDVYIVERILDKRGSGARTEYLIRWRGFPNPEDDTWEPVQNCNCPELIEEFESEWSRKKKAEKEAKAMNRSSSKATPASESSPPKKIGRSESPTTSKKQTRAQTKTGRNSAASRKSKAIVSSNSGSSSPEVAPESAAPESAQSSQGQTPYKSGLVCIPVAQVKPLTFTAVEVVGIIREDNQMKCVVNTEAGVMEIADIKALALQNLDLIMDYIMQHFELLAPTG